MKKLTYCVITTKFDGTKFTATGLTLTQARELVADILRHHDEHPTTALWVDAEIWVA